MPARGGGGVEQESQLDNMFFKPEESGAGTGQQVEKRKADPVDR